MINKIYRKNTFQITQSSQLKQNNPAGNEDKNDIQQHFLILPFIGIHLQQAIPHKQENTKAKFYKVIKKSILDFNMQKYRCKVYVRDLKY